jgi:hypothetical protein
MPLPTRFCSGMRHCQPQSWAIERVSGRAGPIDSVCTAIALSLNSQCDQSSYSTPRVWPSSSERKPVQSMNRSPSMRLPESSSRAAMSPFGGLLDLGDLRFDALDAEVLAEAAQEARVAAGVEVVGVVHAVVGQVGEFVSSDAFSSRQ